jgi:hypothetical protein
MTTLEQKEKNTNSKLYCYAKDHGVFHFAFLSRNGKKVSAVTSEKITLSDVKEWVCRKENKKFADWKIIDNNGCITMVKPETV